ncbi:MAG: DUF1186 domain-containing protein [Amaricoccus sp.]
MTTTELAEPEAAAGEAPMTPEAIMAAFGERGPLPREAIEAAREAREALVPVFLDHIDGLMTADLDAAADDLAFVFVYHLLAEWRETRAYRPLLRLMRRDPEFLDILMGDGTTECAARVVASVFDGDLEPIFEAALDEGADEYLRAGMFDAMAMLAVEQPPLAPAVAAFLGRFPSVAGEDTPGIVWCAWSFAVSDLALTDLAPVVRQAYAEGRVDRLLARVEDFEKELAESVRTGRPGGPRRRGIIADTIAELETWYCFSEAYLKGEGERVASDTDDFLADLFADDLPFIRSEPKVGRNDPCPCGSGRKYKKCCLA